jgi:hypothetical protein
MDAPENERLPQRWLSELSKTESLTWLLLTTEEQAPTTDTDAPGEQSGVRIV